MSKGKQNCSCDIIFSLGRRMADRFQPDCDPLGRFSLYVVLQRSDETENFNRVEKRAAPEDMGAISVFLSYIGNIFPL